MLSELGKRGREASSKSKNNWAPQKKRKCNETIVIKVEDDEEQTLDYPFGHLGKQASSIDDDLLEEPLAQEMEDLQLVDRGISE